MGNPRKEQTKQIAIVFFCFSSYSLTKILKQIHHGHLALRYYMFHQWNFINKQFLNLQNDLLPEDKDNFKYELGNIDLDDFFDYACIGFKKYLLKENMLEFEQHKKRSNR